jgi:hypothetical protein
MSWLMLLGVAAAGVLVVVGIVVAVVFVALRAGGDKKDKHSD